MLYREMPPHPKLARFVKLIWVLQADDPDRLAKERIVPDGIVEAVIHFADPFLTLYGDGSVERQPTSFLISQTRRFIDLQPTGKSGFVAVYFYPWGAHHFFDLPVREFADQTIPASEVWGRSARELEDRISLAGDNEQRVEIVQSFLLRRLDRHYKQEVDRLVRFVWQRRGRVAIKPMARELGVSERRLERLFNSSIGAAPKRFARITRFLESCRMLRCNGFESLTEVAYQRGYYDQSHFIKEFRDFSGVTPGAFVADSSISFFEIE